MKFLEPVIAHHPPHHDLRWVLNAFSGRDHCAMASPNVIVMSVWWVEEVELDSSVNKTRLQSCTVQLRLALANSCLLCLSDSVGFGWWLGYRLRPPPPQKKARYR